MENTRVIDPQQRPAGTVKLEYFEKKLQGSEAGRRVIEIFAQHGEEVIDLVNQNRRVGVTWQRCHGPVFIQTMLKQGLGDETRIPRSIDGVTLSDLLLRMGDALQQNGSPELKRQIGRSTLHVLQWAEGCKSLGEMVQWIHGKSEEKD